MKILELLEMAQRIGNADSEMERFGMSLYNEFQRGVEFRKIGNYVIKKNNTKNMIMYGVFNNDELIGYATVILGKIKVFEMMWIAEKYRNSKLSITLFMVVIEDGNVPILMSLQQSDTSYNLVKRGKFAMFNQSWYNIKSGEHRQFDKDTVDEYYTYGKDDNGWRLLLR
jgi:hypothetical protein